MLASDAIDHLAETELKQLSIRNDKAVVLGFLNQAILAIYKRFKLWEETAVVTVVDAVFKYELDGVDANVAMDLSDHQFLMVDEIYLLTETDYEEDQQLFLDDVRDPDSIDTPKYNRVQRHDHPDTIVLPGRQFKVIYRASPLDITDSKLPIALPPQFFEAMYHYVGFRGHGSQKGDEKSENNTHFRRFEKSCNRIVFDGLYNQDDLISNKFEMRGFV